ncbi:glycoside hydrolase family 9 protein [Cytophaga aurantiaca]|uniref:glycoside hydrolase family 9 protein n=1 Tax=Cytophaga aurantiaca TaxID=29530 RepID=UPI000381AEDE|nr:glycoside hydrolase family 9 protein [Cytophaga aurantiaca]
MKIIKLTFFLLFISSVYAQTTTKYIVVDQFGYRPSSTKVAVIRDPQTGFDAGETFTPGTTYKVINAATNATTFQGTPVAWNNGATNAQSGDKCWWFDFSSVTSSGNYYILDVAKNVKSYTFEIRDNIYLDPMKQAARALFYQRAGFAKNMPYAEAGWVDGASHLGPLQDANCRLYSDKNNPATERDLRGGWFDAGDLNQYTVNTSAYCIQLCLAYKENPDVFGDDYNIPESGNSFPDILDENKWGLDWLLRMQETNGSVLCVKGVDNVSPPSSATKQSLYGPATTNATFAGASAYALASTVYGQFPAYKTYSDKLKAAAIKAWDWGVANPDVQFHNNSASNNSKGLAAGDQEGGYDIFSKIQAAGYLFLATGDVKYKNFVESNCNQLPLWIWGNFVDQYRAKHQDFLMEYSQMPGVSPAFAAEIKTKLLAGFSGPNNYIGKLQSKADPYRSYIGDYNWGSNSYKLFYGTQFHSMAKVGLDPANSNAFIKNAEEYVHYIHGVNPLDIVYMTNMSRFGAEKSVTQIFHTWFQGPKWDQVGASTYGPPPGYLPMGPNPGVKVDACCASNCSGQPACQAYAAWQGQVQPPVKAYLDMNDGWPSSSWEISEVSCGSQIDYIRLVSKFIEPIQNTPYSATPITIAGTIEVENYDKGGEGISFHDNEAANMGATYRTDAVDIGTLTGGGNFVGWTATGEWMEYSVNVTKTSSYDFKFLTASIGGGGVLSLTVDGNPLLTNVNVPSTGDWNTYTAFSKTATLNQGNHVIRLLINNFGFNIDKIVVSEAASCSASISSTANAFCAGGSVVLTASAGTSYKWFNGTMQVGTSATYTATAAGSYTVEVTNASGCKATSAAKVIAVNPLPVITHNVNTNGNWTAAATATVCATTNVIIGPWPIVETGWAWTGPNNFTAATREISLNNSQANQSGIYTATYRDANGCSATSTFNFQVNAATLWYADTDNDGKGNPSVTISSCTKPAGYVAIAGDACPTDANKITPGNCGCNKTEGSCMDCAGVANGTAIIDACNKCAGGTTGIAIVTNPNQCVTTTVPSISGPLCVTTGANNNYLFNAGSLSIASINWWTNSGAAVTQNTANAKQVLINFPAYANGTNATITAGVNLNAAPWYQEFTLLVKVGGCTGSTPQLRASATPLPFNALTTVSLDNNELINTIRIVDMNGVEVFNQNNINENSFELGADLPTGMYIAYVTSNKGTSIVKLVKNN